MAVDHENPYASPASDDAPKGSPFISRHEWRGHAVAVEGALLPSRLWVVIGYTITIDGQQRFETAQTSSTENFTWQFIHMGRTATGHFETFGFNNGIVRKYRLWLDGELLGTFKVRLRGWWVAYLILIGGVTGGIALASVVTW
jgi:hypothetical protein